MDTDNARQIGEQPVVPTPAQRGCLRHPLGPLSDCRACAARGLMLDGDIFGSLQALVVEVPLQAHLTLPEDPCAFCSEPYSEHTTAEMESCWADLREVEAIDNDKEAGDDIVVF